MEIVINISEKIYREAIESGYSHLYDEEVANAVADGTPLTEGAEILTKEAYSDLCLRTSQERKTGRWVVLHDEYGDVVEAVCSMCDMNGNHKWQYCPRCGSKMEGAEE